MHSRVPSEPAGAVTEVDDAAPAASDAVVPEQPDQLTRPDQPPPAPRAARRPTLWEQGRHPGRLVLRATTLLLLVAVAAEVLLLGSLGLLFALVFVAACALIALWVHPRDFFMVGVYPPILLGSVVVVLGVVHPGAVARASDPAAQAVVSGLAHQALPLVIGYALTLGILALRQVALRHRGRLRLR